MIKHFVAIVILFNTVSAQAQVFTNSVDIPLAVVNSDGGQWPHQPSQLVLEVSPADGALQTLRIEQPENNVLRFSVQELLSPSPVVTISRGFISKDVLLLQILPPFDALQGGTVRIIMMRQYGIFSDDYRVLDVDLLRTTGGGWALARGREGSSPYDVTSLYFNSRVTGAGEVGIESIDLYSGTLLVESFNTSALEGPSVAALTTLRGGSPLFQFSPDLFHLH